MKWELAAVGPEHAALLAALHRSAPGPWTESAWRALLHGQGALTLVAAADGASCAFVHCRRIGREAEVIMLVTEPDHRRRGAARMLVESACRRLSLDGASTVFLEVAEGNAPARTLYEGCGFVPVGVRRNYYRTPSGREHALVMRRTLAAGPAVRGAGRSKCGAPHAPGPPSTDSKSG